MDIKRLEFIKKAKEKHGDRYDYSKVIYINSNTDVIIICKIHNTFPQKPNNHLIGSNCPKCAIESRANKRRTNIDDFINKANKKFNNKYNYSKSIYKNTDTDIIIICPNHGDQPMTPYHHLKSKTGCDECGKLDSIKNRTKDTDILLKEIKEKFDDKIDLSKINYINSKTDIMLICKKHKKEFSITPNRLLISKFACPDCVSDNKKIIFRKTLDIFIKEANNKFNNKFDYTKVEYINSKTPIIIICPIHNEIEITPFQHLDSPTGCTKCSGKYKKNTEDFINEAIKIHGDLYDYSKVKYINTHTNVTIYCKKHKKDYPQTPSMHLSGSRCKICADEDGSEKRRYTLKEFIEMAKETHQNNLDDYSSINYIDISNKINITCNIHGIYPQRPIDHIRGHRCSKCGKDKLSLQFRLTLEEFIDRSNKKHNNIYDYSNVEYINTSTKVKIKCPHHDKLFNQTPHNHLSGSGCGICKNKTEKKLYEELTKYYNIYHGSPFEWCVNNKTSRKLPFDFLLEDYKLIIELDGLQHFKQIMNWQPFEETHSRDIYKMQCANENNYSIIRLLQEDVWNDKYEWLNELKSNIEKIKKEKKVQNIYMCKNNEYDDFTKINFELIDDNEISDGGSDDDSYDDSDDESIDEEENNSIYEGSFSDYEEEYINGNIKKIK